MLDAYSHYLLRCEAVLDPDGEHVRPILDSAFQELGVPVAIRSDGGPPYASTGPALLTRLSAWLLELGIRVEIIDPGKPQQNGRLERFHCTLGAETASPPERDLRAQQRRFDPWRYEYPRPLLAASPDPFGHVARIDKRGFIQWNRRSVFISSALGPTNPAAAAGFASRCAGSGGAR